MSGQTITVGPGNYTVTVTNANGCTATSAQTSITQKTTTSIVQPTNPPPTPRAQPVTLNVNASGTNLLYQWYEGTAGTTTKPLGTAAQQTVGPWTKKGTFPYWVRVTGDCGVVSSTTINVTVTN